MTRSDTSSVNTVSAPWRLISVIAESHNNTIALVQNQENHKYSVAKILNEDQQTLLTSLRAEANLLGALEHQKILKSEGFKENVVFTAGDGEEFTAPAMMMEYAANGDLFDLLTKFNQLPSFVAKAYSKQIVQALSYLHEKGMAHLDIKLENFLLDEKYEIKVADFGFARSLSDDQLIEAQVGTPDYWSPEQKALVPFNGFKADIFQLGVVLFILVAGRMPFESAANDDEYYSHFFNGESEMFWEMHEEEMNPSSGVPFFKGEFKSLINGMLCYKPEERMTIQEVLNHPWLNVCPEMVDKCGGIVSEFLKKKSRII